MSESFPLGPNDIKHATACFSPYLALRIDVLKLPYSDGVLLKKVMIEQALTRLTELQHTVEKALTNDLRNVTMVFPDFADTLLHNIRFGCFGDHIPGLDWRTSGSFIVDLTYFTIIEEKASLLTGLKVFGSDVPREHRNESLHIIYAFDPIQQRIHNSDFHPNYEETFQLHPTLPPPHIVFGHDEHELIDVPRWQWEYIDEYETWMWNEMQQLYRKYYQIGGWGSFRQCSYHESYIAQANTQHGDNGAIYLIHEDRFLALDQMS